MIKKRHTDCDKTLANAHFPQRHYRGCSECFYVTDAPECVTKNEQLIKNPSHPHHDKSNSQ